MPPGSKKKRQAKRKKAIPINHRQQDEESPHSPTNPDPKSSVVHHRGSGEDEGEEMFKTPTFQPDLADESSCSRRKDDVELKFTEVPLNGVGSSIAEESDDLDGAPEVEAVPAAAVIRETDPQAPIEQIEACSRNEKGVKIVPWPVEAVCNGNGEDADDAHGRLKIEISIDESFKDLKFEDVDDANGRLENASSIDESFKDLIFEDADANGRLDTEILIDEGSKDLKFEDADANGRLETEILIDEGSKDLKFEDSAEDPVSVDGNSNDVVIESVHGSVLESEERREDIEVVGVIETSSHEREVKELTQVKEMDRRSPDDALTETEQRIEIVRGPLVVRRASLWNCCGLFEALTGSGS